MFSHAVGREGPYRQTSLACVGSTCSVLVTLGLPLLTACVISPSTLLRLQAALQGAGPELHALPRPTPLRFRFSGSPQRCRLGWACVLCLPRSKQLRQLGARGAHSPQLQCALSPPRSHPQFRRTPVACICLVSIFGSWPLATTHLADVDHPESQEVFG